MQLAQIENPVLSPKIRELSGVEFFQDFLPRIVTLVFVIASLAFFFVVVIGAIQWITSGGDKAGVEAARGRITSAVVGLFIIFSLYAILKIVEGFFGIKIITIDISPLFLSQ